MNNINQVIILTSYTLSSYCLFGTSIMLYNQRLLKYPNNLFDIADFLNLSIMVVTGFSVIKLTMKSIEMLENL